MVTKEQYLADVARFLGLPMMAGWRRRRALWFYLCSWAPQGAAIQIRCESSDDDLVGMELSIA